MDYEARHHVLLSRPLLIYPFSGPVTNRIIKPKVSFLYYNARQPPTPLILVHLSILLFLLIQNSALQLATAFCIFRKNIIKVLSFSPSILLAQFLLTHGT